MTREEKEKQVQNVDSEPKLNVRSLQCIKVEIWNETLCFSVLLSFFEGYKRALKELQVIGSYTLHLNSVIIFVHSLLSQSIRVLVIAVRLTGLI